LSSTIVVPGGTASSSHSASQRWKNAPSTTPSKTQGAPPGTEGGLTVTDLRVGPCGSSVGTVVDVGSSVETLAAVGSPVGTVVAVAVLVAVAVASPHWPVESIWPTQSVLLSLSARTPSGQVVVPE
jgi:hypothetical protein